MGLASEERKKIEAWAKDEDAKLQATDPRFNHRVQLVHEDGSVFIIMDAFIEKKDKWVVVFSEHHGTIIYDVDDLIVCQESDKKLKDISG